MKGWGMLKVRRFNNYSDNPVLAFSWHKIVSGLYPDPQNGGCCGRCYCHDAILGAGKLASSPR